MKTQTKTLLTVLATSACVGSAQAAWIAYHDMGAVTGASNPNFVTYHQLAAAETKTDPLNTSPANLLIYNDGTDTGADVTIAGANGMDNRAGTTAPPASSTPAGDLFLVAGLDLSNGTIREGGSGGSGLTTYTLTGLDANELYDLAFYGHRDTTNDGAEEFILGGADSATNAASGGIINATTTQLDIRNSASAGKLIRWTDIDPGDDGTITVTMNPEFTNGSNILYISAMRLEEQVPEPGSLALLGLGGLCMLKRRRRG